MTITSRPSLAALVLLLCVVSPARAQLGQLGRAVDRVQQIRQEFTFTDAEEQQLGAEISARLRQKYGVLQDVATHQYVALAGTLAAQASTRANLKWTFVVLDTDGVNAFAAPGGFIHITRGALALITNEAELTAVLAHEIGHVTARHTLKAIQKSKGMDALTKASRTDFLKQVAERGYAAVLENRFDRGDEVEADRIGVTLANQAGYAPAALGAFLTRLAERNKELKEPSGIFASHPETRARLTALSSAIASGSLKGSALGRTRYETRVPFRPVPVAAVPQTAGGAREGTTAAPGGAFGIGNMTALGREKSTNETVSSAGSRGVNPDRDARGGPNPALVVVTVTTAQLAEFRSGITG